MWSPMGSQFDLFLLYFDGGGGVEEVFWTSIYRRYLLVFDLFFFYCDGRWWMVDGGWWMDSKKVL